MSPARLVLTSSADGFMRRRSAAVTMPRVAGDEPHVQRDDVALFVEVFSAGGHRVSVGSRALLRGLARPDQDVHAERTSVAGDGGADPSVAVDAERLLAQRVSDADLPASFLKRAHLLGDLAHGRENQTPGELSGGVRRRARVLIRRDDDAAPGTRVDVDVRIHAPLTDEPELVQAFEQRRPYLGALADQHERLGVA